MIGMIRSRIEINTDFGLDGFYYSRAEFNFGMFWNAKYYI